MTQDEYNELRAHVDVVTTQDVHLGRVLALMASHLPGYSDAAQAKAEAEQAAKEQEAASTVPAEEPTA